MADILYHGGPCDGTHATYDPEQAGAGLTSCKGFVYHVYSVGSGEYLGLVPGAKPPAQTFDAQPVAATVPPEAQSAWRTFTHAVGREVPRHVNETARLRRAIRRTGRL